MLHLVAHLGRPLDLAAQDAAGRHLDRAPALLVDEVAHHERGLLDPRHEPQRGEVGHRAEVAVALVPVGVAVARQRRHVDVDREQVVAGLDAAVEHVVAEEATGHPLAHEPTLEVGEDHQHRVELVGVDQLLEPLHVERRAAIHPVWSTRAWCRRR